MPSRALKVAGELLRNAVCEKCGHVRTEHATPLDAPAPCGLCRCRAFTPARFLLAQVPERHLVKDSVVEAMIECLELALFPFQESEEEQESFTQEGRARVRAWIRINFHMLFDRAEAAEDDWQAAVRELAALRRAQR